MTLAELSLKRPVTAIMFFVTMVVVGLIAALETHFGISVADDEIHARHFATLGSLTAFVTGKLA